MLDLPSYRFRSDYVARILHHYSGVNLPQQVADNKPGQPYFATINLKTGAIRQEQRSFPSDFISKEKFGIFSLGYEPDSCWLPEDQRGKECTCFSIHSLAEASALALEEFTICQQIGMDAFCKRVRERDTAVVEWDKSLDGDSIEPTFIPTPWETGAA